MAVDVLVEEVAELAGPAGVAGLGAEGAHPDEVACAGVARREARVRARGDAGRPPASTSIQSPLTL